MRGTAWPSAAAVLPLPDCFWGKRGPGVPAGVAGTGIKPRGLLAFSRAWFGQQMRAFEPCLEQARLCPRGPALLAGAGEGTTLPSLGLVPGALKSTSFPRLVVTVLIS